MRPALPTSFLVLSLLFGGVAALSACGQDTTSPAQPQDAPGESVEAQTPPEVEELLASLASARATDAAGLLSEHALEHVDAPAGAPSEAANYDLIQGSALALSQAEEQSLAEHGFVISGRQQFPTFGYGYVAIYADDLPVFISADSIMHAVHQSFGDLLKYMEESALRPALEATLRQMREALARGEVQALGAEAERDLDLYLAVALALLSGEEAPVEGLHAENVNDFEALVSGARAASGMKRVELFGQARDVDFSQFTPRGHYTLEPALTQYFQAMMWLGRIDLRLLETMPDHSQVFRRRQMLAALGMVALMDADSRERWTNIDRTLENFVGPTDAMTPTDMSTLYEALGSRDLEEISAMSSEELVDALNEGDLGYQQISSHVMFNGLDAGQMPLSRTFLLLGQRYAVDSHVLSNVVYDRATADSVNRRMMPNPLDVAFAALGNDQAAELLRSELETYDYAGDLKAMRTLVDGNDSEFWQQSLYNLWLGALRALSPKASEVADPTAHGLPQLAGTEAWGRRMLNTQLASWAELRHDTLLYTKQSYTGANSCEFPDAYVDPYPAFYQALVDFADRGQAIIDALEFENAYRSEWLSGYFDNLRFVATMLGEMAEHQRNGEPFTEEQMAFVNDAVEEQDGCGSPVGITGWYNRLFLDSLKAIEFDPTIADVHTQPTLDGGQVVGRVLHVGTGWARQAVVTVDTCSGPKAYVGLVSSYFEHITEDFDRLDNARWSEHLSNQEPAEVEWMDDLVVR